jgi:hypothetical protein
MHLLQAPPQPAARSLSAPGPCSGRWTAGAGAGPAPLFGEAAMGPARLRRAWRNCWRVGRASPRAARRIWLSGRCCGVGQMCAGCAVRASCPRSSLPAFSTTQYLANEAPLEQEPSAPWNRQGSRISQRPSPRRKSAANAASLLNMATTGEEGWKNKLQLPPKDARVRTEVGCACEPIAGRSASAGLCVGTMRLTWGGLGRRM